MAIIQSIWKRTACYSKPAKAIIVLLSGVAWQVLAQTPTNATFNVNPQLSEPAKSHPMLMLTLAGDHQVFLKAYNDFDDLDGDELPEVTYSHNVVYKGYFNEEKCYSYSSGVFTPAANATAPTAVNSTLGIKAAALNIKQYCASGRWSGNFLNWATMTRIDIVRSVLYGGKRSTDTATSTILERAYLPNDGHSFAKYYNGSDITQLTGISSTNFSTSDSDQKKNGLTFCNTSLGHANNTVSQSQTNTVASMRVARGNYSLWASGERFQCLLGYDASNNKEFNEYDPDAFGLNGNDPSITGIHAYSNVPYGKNRSGTHWLADYTVRVAVCTDSTEDNIHYCRRYGTSYKPTGLLQTYGIHSDNPVLFGLMTNAVNKNKSGGVLRKNVSSMADEVSTTDGTFLRPSTGSIIASIDAMKLLDHYFRLEGATHDNTGTYNPTCEWFWSRFDEGQCRNWGNPFSEMLAQSYRYLAGNNNQSPLNATERSNETTALSGSTAPNWQDPFTGVASQACVSMNVLGMTASGASYDSDYFKSGTTAKTFSSIGMGNSTQTLIDWTNLVGNGELVSTKKYFVGNNGTTNDGQCTPKTLSSLAAVTGICPETPRLDGSFLAAGLAYHAKANNMRPDKFAATGKAFNINTLGLTLAGTQPIIEVPETNVKIIPACRNKWIDTDHVPNVEAGNCALVGFRPIYTTNGTPPNKYFITWEDTEQGSDFDQDINGIIEYTKSGSTVTVKTTIFRVSTGAQVLFGYVISGTTADGLKLNTHANKPWPGPTNDYDDTTAYTIGSSDVLSLESPLFYAAKWGSYTNAPEDTDPKFNPNTDSWSEDGETPTNYALVSNPSTLRESLGKILVKAGKNNATATSAPVSINSITGEGIFLQTVYQPVYVSPDGSSSTSWVGTVSALFLDRYGNIREDSNSNQTLDVTDKVVEFIKVDVLTQNVDGSSESRKVIGFNRYPFSETKKGKDLSDSTAVELGLSMDKLKDMWSARDRLAAISDTNIGLQRGTDDSANQKRLIITGLDTLKAGVYDKMITADETIAFTGDTTTADKLRTHLDVSTSAIATNVINYVRGKEVSGYRNRTVKFDSTSSAKVWRLGDIVNSTPAIVGAPSAGYDALYGDDSYAAFRKKYAKRRNMVYVGANDGMLHAFNAGFFDSVNAKFTNAPTGNDAAAPALGAEMWGYVPFNLLPHLKWLTAKNYEHVFYVDANVKVFDANIFGSKNNSEKYPHGWGTILAVGMRYGGGEYEIDRDGNAGTTTDKTKLRSAYILFDITDPESPPELIAEATVSGLGYTLADPEIIKRRTPNSHGSYTSNVSVNDWYMVFGSGPQGTDAVKEAISNVPAKLFYLNLKEAVAGNIVLSEVAVDTVGTKSFVGGITAKDWSKNYHDDMIYFGLVGNDNRGTGVPFPAPAAYKGVLKQAVVAATGSTILTADTVTSLLRQSDANLPFSSAPLAVRDGRGQFWIFAGTGRFLVNKDMDLTHDNFYYGIKVNDLDEDANKPWLTDSYVALSSLRNVTNDKLYVSDEGALIVRNSSGNSTLTDYLASTASTSGWYREFTGTKETNFTRSAFYEGTLIINSYQPALSSCEVGGNSPQYVLDMFTGLPQYRLKTLFTGSDTLSVEETAYTEVVPVGTVIEGIASSPVIANARAITQTSDAALKTTDITPAAIPPVRRAWREVLSDELR
jgi:type IV pilus assembly protein PilY1